MRLELNLFMFLCLYKYNCWLFRGDNVLLVLTGIVLCVFTMVFFTCAGMLFGFFVVCLKNLLFYDLGMMLFNVFLKCVVNVGFDGLMMSDVDVCS